MTPPTVPTEMGIYISPLKNSSLPFCDSLCTTEYLVKGRYWPECEAKAWHVPSMALQSCPVARHTALIPFMIPLLWVTALYLSTEANFQA